jgi:hypothetical protein
MRAALMALLLIPIITLAAEWEYRVIYLAGSLDTRKLSKPKYIGLQQEGKFLVDVSKTEVLNELANQGWEVIAVVGAVGGDHVVYLKRKR